MKKLFKQRLHFQAKTITFARSKKQTMSTATATYKRKNRVYEPVQDPTSQQGFNRYAYCFYNPLKYTDPKLRREVTSMSSTNDGVTDYSYNFLYEDNELVCIFAPFGRVTPMILHQSQLNKSSIVTSLWTSFQ